MQKHHVKIGDIVEVLSGKERGKRGKVLQVITGENKVLVEKLNMIKRENIKK